ncbi:hypothetical protein HK097_007544, partial [Rhizophlyctis rosea]
GEVKKKMQEGKDAEEGDVEGTRGSLESIAERIADENNGKEEKPAEEGLVDDSDRPTPVDVARSESPTKTDDGEESPRKAAARANRQSWAHALSAKEVVEESGSDVGSSVC